MEEEKTTDSGSYFKKDQTVIHTMPKRYLGSSKVSPSHTKSTGLIILVVGALMLCATFVFLFLYYSKPKEDTQVNDNILRNKPVENTEKPENKLLSEEEPLDVMDNEITDDEQINEEADYYNYYENDNKITEEEQLLASSTEVLNSTSTEKVIIGPATTTPRVFTSANDSDGDGLGDIEELLLDCNIASVDSDGDGYDDLAELASLYNPAGGGKIIVNPNIERYNNLTYRYSLYYPNIWILKTVGGDESLLFQISTDQFIQLAVEPNSENKTIDEWYKEQFGVDQIKNEQRISKKGWIGIKSEDGLVVYLIYPGDQNIFAISYNPGVEGVVNYMNIFNLIINSLEING